MSVLTSALNNASFLPEEDEKAFSHLKSLPLSSLLLKIKLDSQVLK